MSSPSSRRPPASARARSSNPGGPANELEEDGKAGLASPLLVYGVHPVLELVDGRPRDVERIYVSRERVAGLGRLLRKAREAGIPVAHLARETLARKIGSRAVHQGIAAQVASIHYAEPRELCAAARARAAGLLVLVDGVTDPGNLGAIVRTCAAGGVDGVILSREGTVGLTPAVAKVAAGAIERVPVARESKPGPCLQGLAEDGFSICGLEPQGSTPWDEVDLRGPVAVVLGGEHRGLRPGLARHCHYRVAIPMASGVDSLNVAVALAVLLFEAVRQRRLVSGGP